MAVGIAERRQILAELERQAAAQLVVLWKQAGQVGDFRGYIVEAFPELAAMWSELTASLAATWYEESLPGSPYIATPAAAPKVEQMVSSVSWALNVGDATTALDLLDGTMQRAVHDAAMRTTEWNTELVGGGARWARHASANACGFCRLLATRGAVFHSASSAGLVGGRGKDVSTNFNPDGSRKSGGQAKGIRTRGSQKIGSKFHDHDHCVVTEIRAGQSYEPPPYVAKWADEYAAARDEGASSLKGIMREMRKNDL